MREYAVIFVHGLAKKPPLAKLEEIWRWGLSRPNPKGDVFPNPNPGIDLDVKGVPAVFNYYADVFYGESYEVEFGSYYESEVAIVHEDRFEAVAGDLVLPHSLSQKESDFLQAFERAMAKQPTPPDMPPPIRSTKAATDPGQLEIAAWLPGPIKAAIIKKAAMEAYYFLFDKEYVREDGKRFQVRKELRNRLLESLLQAKQQARKLVLVTHSMGTMVAYDLLRRVPECPVVETLFTVGSPLGVTEVQDELVAPGARSVDFPASKLQNWINVYDPLDPICGADPRFANDFAEVDGKRILDIEETNWGSWRHTSTHYLAGKLFRTHLAKALGISLA